MALSAFRATRALVLVGIFACVGGCGGATMPASSPSPLLGKPLPSFNRRTLEGTSIDTAELRGRPVVVKFFAKYCKPCEWSLPAAEALHDRRGEEVVLIGISEDEYEADARELVTRFGLSFPIVHDRGQVLSGRFRASELPVTFVASPDGIIRWVGGEAQKQGDLEQAIDAATP